MKSVWCIISFLEVLISFSVSQRIQDANHQIVQNGLLNFGVKMNTILLENNTESKNILFSPFNLYATLALIHLGSNGTTSDEISNVLGIPKTFSPKILHEVLQHFSSAAQTSFHFNKSFKNGTKVDVKASDLKLGSGIFIQKDFKLKAAYVEAVQRHHSSKVFRVDFNNKSEEVKHMINEFIANKTEYRIHELLDEPLSQDTLLMLTSCSHLKSVWLDKFDPALTNRETFYTGKRNFTVKMMNSVVSAPYANISSLGVEVVKLRFIDKACSMFVVLPYENQPLETLLLRNLTSDKINTIVDEINKLDEDFDVVLKLPKTAFKWSKSVKNQLIQLGLDAETFESPDLSDMIEEKNTTRMIEIDDISHSTDIKINEDGSDTNAVSIVSCEWRMYNYESVIFHVNRPFFFFIYNRNVKTVLFFGTVFDPNGDSN
ncbi:leukocyte elastase inhibitor-like [Planococcus citri]|uniref:leukocyte elastase inhibitor-like n=1 Tax=Planococcus citri TaxID=170843 RepID=UPI0031F78DC7